MNDIYTVLAVGFITVFLCTSAAGTLIRGNFNPLGVFNCCYCTSFWVSLITSPLVTTDLLWLRVPAIAAASNIVTLLIHMSMSTYEE